MCRRRLKKLAALPFITVGSMGFALVLLYLSYRGGDPVYDSVHKE